MEEKNMLILMVLLVGGAGFYIYTKRENEAKKKSDIGAPSSGDPLADAHPDFGVSYPGIGFPSYDAEPEYRERVNPWNPMPLYRPKPRYGIDLPLYPMPSDSAVEASNAPPAKSSWTKSDSSSDPPSFLDDIKSGKYPGVQWPPPKPANYWRDNLDAGNFSSGGYYR